MIAEIRTLFEILGPQKMLRNARTMKQARSSIRGYGTTIAYWALMRVGFIDELAQRSDLSPATFCEQHNLDERILGHLCQYLTRLGHFHEHSGQVAFTRRGRRFWMQVDGVFNIFCAYDPFFSNLVRFLKKETTTESQKRSDAFVALGFRKTGAAVTFAAMVNIMKRNRFTSMIELGCGNIDLTLYVSRILPNLRSLGIDFDEQFLNQARGTIERERLSQRVSLLKHDLFKLDPTVHDFSPYELVTAIDLFHGYFHEGPEKLLGLFRTLRETFPQKKFLVSEMCLADESRMARIAYPMVEHELFHNLTAQKTFAKGQLEALLQEAGFKILQQWPVRNLAARLFILFES